MKKNYIKPYTEILLIETETLLAASMEFEGPTGQGELNETGSEVDAMSKGHFSVWE